MRMGLRWKSHRPSLRETTRPADWAVLAVCLLGYLIVGWNDARTERDIAATAAESSTKQFAQFLSGGVLTDEAGKIAVKCMQIMDVVN
jgi:hypothetical protein